MEEAAEVEVEEENGAKMEVEPEGLEKCAEAFEDPQTALEEKPKLISAIVRIH